MPPQMVSTTPYSFKAVSLKLVVIVGTVGRRHIVRTRKGARSL